MDSTEMKSENLQNRQNNNRLIRLGKRAWELWSALLSFDWLNRLYERNKTLAVCIGTLVFGIVCKVGAWVDRDPRYGFITRRGQASWRAYRIPSDLALVSVVACCFFGLRALRRRYLTKRKMHKRSTYGGKVR